ncbi:hypothetical protein JCM10908_002258 [Rhodotorula pacifica]|uniref:bifunctional C97 family peptidase/thioredoxin family protein n=1 Tax=Rhodotorula pacifica TaxID=1495444 RepID=UPI00317D642A
MGADGEPVQLYIYDLSNGLAAMWGRSLTGQDVEGIWHTSLVLHGVEVFFGQGVSIVTPPGTTHHGVPKKKLSCGVTHLDKETFLEYIENLRDTYRADAYHLLNFNCNTFTNDVLGFLNGSSIPAYIRNQPSEIMSTPFGQQMRPMIEQMFVGRRTPSAGAAVNNLLPQLGITPPATPPTSRTPAPRLPSDAPTVQSVASNLQICTSTASLRTLLSSSPAVAIMFTSPTCPPCSAIKPHFESLAQRHSSPQNRIDFVLVETHLGAGAEIARNAEFGRPVTATPTFVFFSRGKKVGECKGADRQELETQIGILDLTTYPPHPHTKLSLPALDKLASNLNPITFTAFPSLDVLGQKLETSLKSSSLEPANIETLSKRVPEYLRTLPSSGAASGKLPAGLLDSWTTSTLSALQTLPPAAKFPVLDLVRLALARDAARLASSATFIAWIPTLLSHLASDLDHDAPERSYLLTSLRVISNTLVSPTLTARLLAPDTLPSVTRLVVRALLDPQDPKMRSAGAGTAWSIVARVFAARVGEGGLGVEREKQHALGGEGAESGEEWEAEMASAVLEALAKETESVEVVHRLAASLGLLLFKSPYAEEIRSLLEVLDIATTLERKQEMVKKLGKGEEERKEVGAVLRDVRSLTVAE